jgi:hypothetical protein
VGLPILMFQMSPLCNYSLPTAYGAPNSAGKQRRRIICMHVRLTLREEGGRACTDNADMFILLDTRSYALLNKDMPDHPPECLNCSRPWSSKRAFRESRGSPTSWSGAASIAVCCNRPKNLMSFTKRCCFTLRIVAGNSSVQSRGSFSPSQFVGILERRYADAAHGSYLGCRR